jgi:glucose/mannose-6-phosphate isomerase
VATRFRQQVNENAKMLCWHHVIPEMNHNELVGWRTENNDLAVILFRNSTDLDRIQARMEINKQTIAAYTDTIVEVWSKGNSNLERALYLIHLGDWVSFFLGEKKGVDIIEVKVIDHLKGELAKLA